MTDSQRTKEQRFAERLRELARVQFKHDNSDDYTDDGRLLLEVADSLDLIREQAGGGLEADHDCPAVYACACIIAEFGPSDGGDEWEAYDRDAKANL